MTAIDASTGGPTVRVVELEIAPKEAVMVLEPWVTLLARPLALIVATPGDKEFQVTMADMSWLEPPESEPMAENCWVVPAGIVGLIGVTVIEFTGETVSVA